MSEHLADELIAQLAEGELDGAASTHAASCAECTRRIESYKRTAALVASYAPASRNLCPPREALIDRAALPGLERAALAAHLDACPLCREDLADLAALEAAPRVALAVRFARGLVELLENALGDLVPQPAPAPARGASSAPAVAVRRELAAGVVLEVALAPGREGVDVLVRVSGAPRFRVELAREGRLVEGREPQDGRVLFDSVPAGEYELVVHRPEAPPVEVALAVRA